MSITVTEVSSFERRLTISFENPLLDSAETRAARRLSREIHINGFRRGRAPRRMVENIVGRERVRHEAMEDLLTRHLPDALNDTGLVPAVTPIIDKVRDTEDGLEVDIMVSLWPAVDEPPDYVGRHIELDSDAYMIDEALIESEIKDYREEFCELETVQRPSVADDQVEIDLIVSYDGSPVDALSISDYLLEVGLDGLYEGLGDQLAGRSVGDIFDFDSSLQFEAGGFEVGTPVRVRVLVKRVYEERLPDLDDEWVSDFTEFETVQELRASVIGDLEAERQDALRFDLRNRVVSELMGELEVDIPPTIIDADVVRRFESFNENLKGYRLSLDEYLEASALDREGFLSELRGQAIRELRLRLLLDSVVTDAAIEVAEHELAEAYESMAEQSEETGPQLAERLAGSVQESALVGSILRGKAMDTLLECVVAVDRDGNVIDLDTVHGEDEYMVESEIEGVDP